MFLNRCVPPCPTIKISGSFFKPVIGVITQGFLVVDLFCFALIPGNQRC